MLHALKTWPGYFKAVKDGSKPFEIRRNDRPFKVGDTLMLQEYNNDGSEYTGQEYATIITYILSGSEAENLGCKKGYCILGIKEKENP